MQYIETKAQLREVYGQAWPDAIRKQMRQLDRHARRFLELSPMVMIGSQDAQGRADVTPRGDKPGFVLPLDDRRIALPDRPGNNRLDTFENILDDPTVGLLFLIPGVNETLRINGAGRITADADLCARFSINENPARSVLIVEIQEVFLHCAKAFLRSGFWAHERWPHRSELPTLGEMVRDQLDIEAPAADLDAALAEAYKTTLW